MIESIDANLPGGEEQYIPTLSGDILAFYQTEGEIWNTSAKISDF